MIYDFDIYIIYIYINIIYEQEHIIITYYTFVNALYTLIIKIILILIEFPAIGIEIQIAEYDNLYKISTSTWNFSRTWPIITYRRLFAGSRDYIYIHLRFS